MRPPDKRLGTLTANLPRSWSPSCVSLQVQGAPAASMVWRWTILVGPWLQLGILVQGSGRGQIGREFKLDRTVTTQRWAAQHWPRGADFGCGAQACGTSPSIKKYLISQRTYTRHPSAQILNGSLPLEKERSCFGIWKSAI